MYKKEVWKYVSCGSRMRPKKVCDENERKKRRAPKNNFCGWDELIVLLEKTAWTDFNELQEIDASPIKGTIYNSSNYFRLKGMIPWVWAHERAPLNSQWLLLKNGGADFYHCWFIDSI